MFPGNAQRTLFLARKSLSKRGTSNMEAQRWLSTEGHINNKK